MANSVRLGGSFRDPSGFVYTREGDLLRQINPSAEADYRALINSGLYAELRDAGLLVPHDEVDLSLAATSEARVILRPERIVTISYPYEWSFSQLKDAALVTLEIQRRALSRGMALKDASAYNIQFHQGSATFIDTLSFEPYEEGAPWVAYRQFCRHFLAPLALMSLVDIRLGQLMRASLDGIPLDLASALLPRKTRFKFGLAMHIHVHGKMENRKATTSVTAPVAKLPKNALLGLVDSLQKQIDRLTWEPKGTQWADYYQDNNYSSSAMKAKHEIVARMVDRMDGPKRLWDFGANTGEFSRIAAAKGIEVVAWDIDPAAVELAYRKVKDKKEINLLPLQQDLMNPSANLGWAEHERDSLLKRGPVDGLFALALIHHLAIANNVPLADIFAYFAQVARFAVVEWVPKEDSQVERLLASREDVFPSYTQKGFETALCGHFEIVESAPIPDSKRTLYLLRRVE